VECLGYTEPPKREAGLKVQEKEVADTVAKALEILIQDKVL
jgi:electron transfer flavoprotein beta subunit